MALTSGIDPKASWYAQVISRGSPVLKYRSIPMIGLKIDFMTQFISAIEREPPGAVGSVTLNISARGSGSQSR